MTLGAEDMQTSNRSNFVMLFICVFLVAIENFGPLIGWNYIFVSRVVPDRALGFVNIDLNLSLRSTKLLSNSLLHAFLLSHELRIAAKQDVSTAAGHVGGDRDHILASRLGHDFRFALVVFGIEHHVLDIFFL